MNIGLKHRFPLLDIKKQWELLWSDDINRSARYMVVITFCFSLLYFVFPFDIIPDLFLGLGYIDDLSVYAILREITYKSAEDDIGPIESISQIIRSRTVLIGILLVGTVVVVSVFYIFMY